MNYKSLKLFGMLVTFCSPQIFAEPELLAICDCFGKGNQYVYLEDPDKTVFAEDGDKVTELTKSDAVYTYSRVGQYAWRLSSTQNQTTKNVFEFKGVKHRGTRLVDVRVNGDHLEVLTFHSQGYYYTLLKEEGGQWSRKVWASIQLDDFLKNSFKGKGEFETNVKSVSIEEGNSVTITRELEEGETSTLSYDVDPNGEKNEDVYFLVKE